MMVVGNRARMGGSERFWVGEYDGGGGGLSEKVVFLPEIIDKSGGFVVDLISGNRCVDR